MIPVIDLHSDTFMRKLAQERMPFLKKCYLKKEGKFEKLPLELHVTPESSRKGNLRVQTQSLFIDTEQTNYPLKTAMKMIARMQQLAEQEEDFTMIRSRNDFEKCLNQEKFGIFTSIEGLEVIENDLDLLDVFHALGVRIVGPTWNRMLPYMGNIVSGFGLFPQGEDLLRKLSENNMLLDVSHISDESFFDIEKKYNGMMIATHSNARAIINEPRNLTDDQLKVITERNGVVGINLATYFLQPKDDKTGHAFDWIWAMIDHIGSNFSEDMIAFGSDFDGIPFLPNGIDNCDFFPQFANYLRDKNVSEETIKKIFYTNAKRVIEMVL